MPSTVSGRSSTGDAAAPVFRAIGKPFFHIYSYYYIYIYIYIYTFVPASYNSFGSRLESLLFKNAGAIVKTSA